MMYDCIPSETEREYLKSIEYKLNEWEQATITYQANSFFSIDIEESNKRLNDLKNTVTDPVLKKQIEERILYEEKCWELFRKNDGSYVFILMHYDDEYNTDEIDGIFRAYNDAEKYGLKKFGEDKFFIKKYQIVGSEIPNSKHIMHLNTNVMPGDSFKICEEEFDGGEVGESSYKKGACYFLWTEEIPVEERKKVDEFNKERFENQIILLPYSFERGDLVCSKIWGKEIYGIVETSCEEWDDMVKRYKVDGFYGDFYDGGITVVFLREDGSFSHDHISPLFLEKVNLEDMPKSDDKTLLTYAIDMVNGVGSLDFFLMAYDERRGRKDRVVLDLE